MEISDMRAVLPFFFPFLPHLLSSLAIPAVLLFSFVTLELGEKSLDKIGIDTRQMDKKKWERK
jgi:hypothetical protein